MSTPGYVFRDSGTTPPAVDGHMKEELLQQHSQLGQQRKGPLSPQTSAQFRPETYAPPEQTAGQNIPQALMREAAVPVAVQTIGQNDLRPFMHEAVVPTADQRVVQSVPRPLTHEETVATTDPTLKEKAHAVVKDTTEILRKNFITDSHELAREDFEVKGAVQTHELRENDTEVRDIGWHKPPVEIPDPLIGGLPNERLWAMIRRFNKDVFDVRAVPMEIARGLDLNDAWSEEHATDKLTLHLQRVYLSITLGLASFIKHVSRLRSWKEARRTTAFCLAYFTAWLFDLLMPLVLGTLIILVASKPARDVLFPPAPLALVNISTGGIQKPQAGQLGTFNTLTGASEKQEGEAVEEEAANFVDNVRHLMMRAVGMHEKQGTDGDPLEGKIPKPARNAIKAFKAEGSAPGHATEDADQTQKPMEEILWSKAKPENLAPVIKIAPHVVGEIADNWERFANVISPTPPFSRFSFIRIDGVLLPLFLMSFYINYYMVYKGIGFAIGFGIFGDPVLTPALDWLNRKYPNWPELLEPKNNILRGAPTNSQLTLTFLRIGEAYNTPLPPVPTSNPDDPDHQKFIDIEDVPLDASRTEVVDAIQPSSMEKAHPGGKSEEDDKSGPKHKHLSKIMRVLKGNTRAAVETRFAVDHVRAAAGSEKAKGHLGVLPKPKNLIYAGPSEYKARFDGKKGWVYITETANPCLSFTTHDPRPDGSQKRLDPILTIAIKDIKRLKRATAFVNKPAEMAADWSTDKELLGSVEIDDEFGKTWRFTALPERDELFNRLVAIGGHRWENM